MRLAASSAARGGVSVPGAYPGHSRGSTPAAPNRGVQAREEMAERVARQMQIGPVQSPMDLAMEARLYEQMAEAGPGAAEEGLQHLHSLVNIIVREHAQSPLTRRPPGHGERRLVGRLERAEMLGGGLRVESMPGKGRLVEFGMPLGAAS